MKKIRVGVIFGGRSGEHEVSLRSAESVLKALDRNKYEVVPIGITHEGRWLASTNAVAMLPAKDQIQKVLTDGDPITLAAEPASQGIVDVIFPIMHGTHGEDGTIQGLLELANVPYVGAGVLGSAIGMDKDVMKRLLREAGLPIVDYWTVRKTDLDAFLSAHISNLPYPVFVKPANLGSSVGITKVHAAEELPAALETAAAYDRKIVVEQGVDAREIEISVLGNDDPVASLPGEIIPSREFYDYEAKYLDGGSREVIPASLPAPLIAEIRAQAIAAFKAIDCAGMARVDFLLAGDSGVLYVNEVNTIPGFTTISMFSKMWAASGLEYPQLLDRLIALALERHGEKQHLRT